MGGRVRWFAAKTFCLFLAFAGATAEAADRYASHLSRGTEIASVFDGKSSIYYKGDFGLDYEMLEKAAAKLSENFFVVILGDVSGESVHIEGNTYTGFEAITGTIQYKLFSSPKFMGIVDEKTGKRRASVLVISLHPGDNRVDYFPSELHEAYGMGKSRIWNMEHPIVQNYAQKKRSGQIVAAFLDTAAEIDKNLNTAVVSEARSKAARAATMKTLVVLLILGVLIIAGMILLWLNRTAMAAKAKLMKDVDHWKTVLASRVQGKLALRKLQFDVRGVLPKDLDPTSDTSKSLNAAVTKVGKVLIMHQLADKAIARILSDMERNFSGWQRMFTATPYEVALKALRAGDAIAFDTKSALQFNLDGKTMSDVDMLGVPASFFQPFNTSFDEYEKSSRILAEEATTALQEIEAARFGAAERVAKASSALQAATVANDALLRQITPGDRDRLATFMREFHPALVKALSNSQALAQRDPLKAARNVEDIERRIAAVKLAIEQLAEGMKTQIPELVSLEQALIGHGCTPAWIPTSVAAVFNSVGLLCQALKDADAPVPESTVKAQLDVLLQSAKVALNLHQNWREVLEPKITETAERISASRRTLGTSFELEPAVIMMEEGRNPDRLLDAARQLGGTLLLELNEGDISDAEQLARRITQSIEAANAIVSSTEQAFAEYQVSRERIEAAAAGLTERRDKVAASLTGLRACFAETAFDLRRDKQGDPVGDHNAANNMEEVEQAEQRRATCLECASTLRSKGQILLATEQLAAADAENATITALYQQVDRIHARITEQVRKNSALLTTLEQLETRLGQSLRNTSVTDQTITLFNQRGKTVADMRSSIDAQQRDSTGDPFASSAKLMELQKTLQQIERAIADDIALFNEAERSVEAAKSQLTALTAAISEAQRDPAPDPKKTEEAPRSRDTWNQALGRLDAQLSQPHGNWREIDRKADEIRNAAAELTGFVLKQLDTAKKCGQAITKARADVQDALAALGRSTAAKQKCGHGKLEEALTAFAAANYEEASTLASQAGKKARAAKRDYEASLTDNDDTDDDWGMPTLGSPTVIFGNFSSPSSSSPRPSYGGGGGGGGRASGGLSIGNTFRPSSGISSGGFSPSKGLSI